MAEDDSQTIAAQKPPLPEGCEPRLEAAGVPPAGLFLHARFLDRRGNGGSCRFFLTQGLSACFLPSGLMMHALPEQGAEPRPDLPKTAARTGGTMDKQIGEILTRAVLQSPDALPAQQAAVESRGKLLAELPDELKTPDMCSVAVRQDPEALEYVPEETKTEALCLDAVRRDGSMLLFVPPALMTEAVCRAAVRQDAASAIFLVPDDLKTEAMCFDAVMQDGLALDAVPENLLTPAICAMAALEAGGADLWDEKATDAAWEAADADAGEREDFRQSFWDRVPERMRGEVESLLEDAEEAAMKP